MARLLIVATGAGIAGFVLALAFRSCGSGSSQPIADPEAVRAAAQAAKDRTIHDQLVGKWHLSDHDYNLGFEGGKDYIILNSDGGFVHWNESSGTAGMLQPIFETALGKAQNMGKWFVKDGNFVVTIDSLNLEKGWLEAHKTYSDQIITAGPDRVVINNYWGTWERVH